MQKRRKWWPKPITSLLDRELRRWLQLYPELVGGYDKRWRVIPRRYLTPAGWYFEPTMPAGNLTDRFTEYTAPFLGGRILGQGGSHTLRRSAAYALILSYDNEEQGIKAAQHMLGHASRQQTEHYVGLRPNALAATRLLRGKDFLPDVETLRRADAAETALRTVREG
jgi:integrase